MAITLPDDILNQISIQLWHARDFDTLFRFALCSKQLAALALVNLYKMQDLAPVKRASEIDIQGKEPGEQTRKWAILWRSIILSTMNGKTIFPYCRYIRVLDLQDLTGLLEDLNGRFINYQKILFTGDLKRFKIRKDDKNPQQISNRLSIDAILVAKLLKTHRSWKNLVVHVITNLELKKWIPRLPKLKALRLYEGQALEDCQTILNRNCPNFKHLYLYNWESKDPDTDYATFLNGLRHNTLESVEVVGSFMKDSLRSLANHSSSLRVLKLHGLGEKSIVALAEMKKATFLKSVLLKSTVSTSNDRPEVMAAFEEITQWLGSCKDLKSLVLPNLELAQRITTTVLLGRDVRLRHLEITYYDMTSNKQFYKALSEHSSLESLLLSCDARNYTRDHIGTLVQSLCNLQNLRKLRLIDISNYFVDKDICMVAKALPLLEEFWVSGYHITDAVWGDLAKLANLKLLSFQAMSKFTFEGIMGFVKSLDDERGMQLEIMYSQDSMADSDKEAIEKEIASKGGSFVFTMWREEDYSSMSSEDEF